MGGTEAFPVRQLWFGILMLLAATLVGCKDLSPSTSEELDKVIYGTVLKIGSVQGLDALGFKQDVTEITLKEDCQVIGTFDTPPNDCQQPPEGSGIVTLSIPKGKMYGPQILTGDYVATRWSCKRTSPNSCVFVKYADAMAKGREEGIHQ
jgi:hypothetical protein